MKIKGKVALVTGGAVRVGKAISLMLAEQGADVAVVYHTSADAASHTVDEARQFGVRALGVQCDVADAASVEAMSRTVLEEFGGVDIVVNGASHFATTPVLDERASAEALEQWRRVTRVQVDGPWYVCHFLAPAMLARGGGVIINILDLALWQSWRGFGAHAAGKAAMLALTRQLALELAPSVRVNAVAPGYVMPPPGYPEDKVKAAAKRTLLGRWGAPTDVAHAIRYLIEADYVTGEVLFVDGGARLASRASAGIGE